MEQKLNLTVDGQELAQEDVNNLAATAAYADDRVLYEFFRLRPEINAGNKKAILPFGLTTGVPLDGLTSNAMFQGDTADASVKVMPFRAIIASQDSSTPLEDLRGMRSGYMVGGSGGTLYRTVTLAANLSSDPRWTLIYAALTPDVDDVAVSRQVQDQTTGEPAPQTLSVTQSATVELGMVDGTSAASPSRPTLPADGGGTYYIALCYVWVVGNFNSTSIVHKRHVHEVCTTIPLHEMVGATTFRAPNHAFLVGGTVDVNQSGESSATRPACYRPPTQTGAVERLILLQLEAGAGAVSHVPGDIVDSSVDYRFRDFEWKIQAREKGHASLQIASAYDAAGTGPVPSAYLSAISAGRPDVSYLVHGMGESYVGSPDGGFTYVDATASKIVAMAIGQDISDTDGLLPIGAGEALVLAVRNSDGALIYNATASVGGQVAIWLRAGGQFQNFSNVANP